MKTPTVICYVQMNNVFTDEFYAENVWLLLADDTVPIGSSETEIRLLKMEHMCGANFRTFILVNVIVSILNEKSNIFLF